MATNVNAFVKDFNKMLVLVRSDRRLMRKLKSIEGKQVNENNLIDLTRTALTYLRNKILPLYKDLSKTYLLFEQNINNYIKKSLTAAKSNKDLKMDVVQNFEQTYRDVINKMLAKAERGLKINKQERKYIEIIEHLAIRMAEGSAKADNIKSKVSIRVSKADKPTKTEKAFVSQRLSYARPLKPEKKWYKPWTWFK